MDTDRDLAVRPLADRSTVLAGHPTHALPHLGNDTSSITHTSDLTTWDSRPAIRDRQRILRRLVHKLLQGLHVPVRQTRGHRLDRLAPAIQHQPAQIALTLHPLIPTWHRGEHI